MSGNISKIIAFAANDELKTLAYQNAVEYFSTLSRYFEKHISTRLDSLAVGDTFKYDLNDIGIYQVIGQQDENWIKVLRTQSLRMDGSFPWTEVYPVKID